MPVASGSIAFLGAARFQGYWNASTNTATGSVYGGISGEKLGIFETGSSPNAGYQVETGLTASKGDYWQVTGSGVHNVDGHTSWELNDFCIFSGSISGLGSWMRLAFEDTIASIILGDLSSSSFHMGTGSDGHVIFASGSVFSGSGDFVYDYLNSKVSVTTVSGTTITPHTLNLGQGGLAGPAATVSASAGTFAVLSGSILSTHAASAKTTLSASALTVHNIELNDVAITSDAGEINLLDGAAAGTLVSSKAVIYSSADIVSGSAFKGFGAIAAEGIFANSTLGIATGSSYTGFRVAATEVSGTTITPHTLNLGQGGLAGPAATVSASFGTFAVLSGSRLSSHEAIAKTTLSASALTVHNITLNNVAISADAGEINLLDGAGAGTLASSKAVIYSSAGVVTGSSFVGFGMQATQANIGIATGSSFTGFSTNTSQVVSAAGVFTGLSASAATVHTLALGNVGITATGTELNLVDGSSAGTLASSKAVIYSSADVVTGSAFVGFRTATTQGTFAASTLGVATGSSFTGFGVAAIQVAAGTVTAPSLSGSAATLHNITLNNVAISADAGEINLLDGAAAGTLASSKAVIYSSADIVTGSAFIGFRAAATQGAFGNTSGGVITGSSFTGFSTAATQVIGAAGTFVALSGSAATLHNITLNNVAVSADAGEINLLDGAAAGTLASSKAVVYSSADVVTGSAFVGFRATVTELGDTTAKSFTASLGALVPDDKRLYFGDSGEGHIAYDETLHDFLTISGSHAGGIALSGSKLMFDVDEVPNLVASGSRGGPGSYLALAANGQVVLSTPDGGSGGAVSSVGNGADNRIATFSDSDALNGEANLTFNGSTLTLAGVMTGSSYSGFNTTTTEGNFVTVSGSAATLHNITLNNVAISADAGEINLLDGASAGTLASSKAVVYSSADVVTGSAFVGFRTAAAEGAFGSTSGGVITGSSFAGFSSNTNLVTAGGITTVALSASAAAVHTLALGNVAISADAGEINLLDGAAAGTLASSKAVIYSSADIVTGSAFAGFRGSFSKVTGFELENASDAGSAALLIDNDDIDEIALDIEAANTTANIVEISGSALTTGAALKVYSASSTTGARSLVQVVNDNASANKTVCLEVNNLSVQPSAIVRGSFVKNNMMQAAINMWVTGQTISASYMVGGNYTVMTRGSSQSDTTDTAGNILGFFSADPRPYDYAEFMYMNLGSNAVTIAGGTNVLMANLQTASFEIAPGKARQFIVQVSSIHPDSPKIQLVPKTDLFNLTS